LIYQILAELIIHFSGGSSIASSDDHHPCRKDPAVILVAPANASGKAGGHAYLSISQLFKIFLAHGDENCLCSMETSRYHMPSFSSWIGNHAHIEISLRELVRLFLGFYQNTHKTAGNQVSIWITFPTPTFRKSSP
jgi:hypothetical protein